MSATGSRSIPADTASSATSTSPTRSFQSILMNSPLADRVVCDELRLVDWTRRPMPWIFRADDLEELRTSPKMVARKFDMTVDAEILDLIDLELLGVDPEEGTGKVEIG